MNYIKFRAWNKKLKVMVNEAIQIGWRGVYAPTMIEADVRNRADTYIIMQFTGLNDKNGKEIYEGDILAHTTMLGSRNEQLRHTVTREVSQPGGHSRFALPSPLYAFEIVGNIYEGDHAS